MLALSTLTRKEHEVLSLVKKGLSNKEIALILFVSVNTIKTHRKNLMCKLDLKGKVEMNKYLLSNTLIMHTK